MNISVKYPVHVEKSIFGKKTGKLRVSIENEDIYGEGKDELTEKVTEAIDEAFKNPEIGVVRVGDEIRIVVTHLGRTCVYDASGPDGQLAVRNTSSSWQSHKKEIDLMIQHLYTAFDYEPGENIPAEVRKEIDYYRSLQKQMMDGQNACS